MYSTIIYTTIVFLLPWHHLLLAHAGRPLSDTRADPAATAWPAPIERDPSPASRSLESLISRGWGWYPSQTSVPQDQILTNATLLATLDRIALPDPSNSTRGTIIFTTVRFGDGDQTETLEMMNSFCYWLHQARLLQHTMIITTDEENTWKGIAEFGHPVYLDRVFPRREAYIDKVLPGDTYNREFDVQKHYWGMRLVELNFRVVYADSDNMIIRSNLLDPFSEPYDVQGLSDWGDPELPRVGETLHKSCGLYFHTNDTRVERGATLREFWHMGPDDVKLDNANPCQSTGLWYLQPTNVTIEFMRAMAHRIAVEAVWHWDQTAWQEVIIPFLWGAGDQRPLRYRLLPVTHFANVGVIEARQNEGLPTNEIVVVHAGGLHGSEKKETYERLELFKPDFRTPIDESVFYDMQTAVSGTGDTGGDVYPNGKLVTTVGTHNWQPTSADTFWLVLWVIVAAMLFGAGSVLAWQAWTGNGDGQAKTPRRKSLERRRVR